MRLHIAQTPLRPSLVTCTEFRLRGNRATCTERSRSKSRFNYREAVGAASRREVLVISHLCLPTGLWTIDLGQLSPVDVLFFLGNSLV
ncbi:hypothetical protein [Nostoc sp. DSM 114167]|jgi:hypothetical protein|uniref:hypothetical protein n=1 Tax=Nostoc sp. DSM 114167 TaxID=3439050 RepID=UPI00404586CF